ncbi:hypothetical protein [Thalassoglobus polymorphus]|uniref:Uncharacterized protein n=1 Tax=Thalassoglobus polymorphus TaxID=2527994 RepID=A0A517QPU5_9PLAN|nr:hypothetical protein [Thalassoglobus polymorphus]QDT33651.1 hypothetical protein Mal48_29050 [Thalassoglobus polymorphus]
MLRLLRQGALLSAVTCTGLLVGCTHCEKCAYMGDITPHPLGTISDPVWQQQETNAEASDFVIHEHEWNGNTVDLNLAGKDHVKQIAARLESTPFPVLIERSSMSVDPDSRFKYPVNNDAELDIARRNLVIAALQDMGIYDAEERVVVSPALTPGYTGFQAQGAYARGMGIRSGGGGGGFGGGGGGGGGAGF